MVGTLDDYKEKFKESGVQPKNIAKTTLFFVGISTLYVTSLWGLCYIVRPTQNIIKKLPYPKVKNFFERANTKAENLNMLRRLPQEKRGRFSISFAEMIAVKTLIGPIALPFKIWLAIKLTKLTNRETKTL